MIIRTAGPGTAISLWAHGEEATWGIQEELLASIADLLAGANWQRGGGKGKQPKPLERPWQRAEKQQVAQSPFGDDFENDALTVEEMDAWLGISSSSKEDAPRALSDREQAVIEYNAGGVSQAQLAQKYGVSQSTISRWVRLTNQLEESELKYNNDN